MQSNNLELEVLDFWNKESIFEKSLKLRENSTPFVIYEGPPTANGMPGLHHVMTRTFKDAIGRFQTMNGRLVERKAGWDEHGLPVELEVQKTLGLHTKQKVEEYGVKEFNEKCKESTQKYVKEWEKLTERMGYWLDFKNAYHTSSDEYVDKVWEVLDDLYSQDLIYQANKIVPWACDSGTVLSNAEVAQGYKKVTHTSAYVLFKLCGGDFGEYAHVLVWTSTPWTLPANMALAINKDIEYKVLQYNDSQVISLLSDELDLPGAVLEKTVKGSELVGKQYFHPVTYKQCNIYHADFVKAENTGIVHIAPAFGADDYKLWQEQMNNEPIICHVEEDGKFNFPKYVGDMPSTFDPDYLRNKLHGKNVIANNFEDANHVILEWLTDRGFFGATRSYEHEYPHNWRTGKPLIYYLRPSWYINVNKIREKLIGANEKVNWYPENVKHGRFGEWLKGNVDWAISRERFWGTPLPFYSSDQTLEKFFFYPSFSHKPAADEVYTEKNENWIRTPEVLDCWFDSGAMPFAAFDEYKQADFICEAVDQTRGWFYSLLVIGTALKNESPYKNVLCLGHLLDKNGNKMSKSKGNVVDPWEMFDKYGADVVRWYMAKTPAGNSISFNEAELKTITQNIVNRIVNCNNFFKTYVKDYQKSYVDTAEPTDVWILNKLQMLTNNTYDSYCNFDLAKVTTEVAEFVDNLSNVWLRANRSRFSANDKAAQYTLYSCLTELCLVIAPVMPFLSEKIWLSYENSSVHLQDYPYTVEVQKTELMDEMNDALSLIKEVHRIRNESGVKLRQVLPSITSPVKFKYFEDFVKREVNVKDVFYGNELKVDTTINTTLLNEGLVREFIRGVQNLRKQSGFNVYDKIEITLDYRNTDYRNTDLKKVIEEYKKEITDKLLIVQWKESSVENDFKIENLTIGVSVLQVV